MLTRRSFRIVLLVLTSLSLWLLLQSLPVERIHHQLPTRSGSPAQVPLPPPPSSVSPQEATAANDSSSSLAEFCGAHGYAPFHLPTAGAADTGPRKVYDLFMINSELDFMELRLETLYDDVDYFVIVESARTFQGRPKNLTIKTNWDRFKKYHKKLIYHQLEFPDDFAPKVTRDYEDLQRDSTFTQVFPRLKGVKVPNKGDVIVVADVDEIPRPETIQLLRSCRFPRRLTLFSKFYYYSFQFLHTGPEWPHPQATFYDGSNTITPTNLRHGIGGSYLQREFFEKGKLYNSTWHCSSCFKTIDQFLDKLSSFSLIWMNDKKYRERDKIAKAVRDGKDLWGRKSETFTRIENNMDIPQPLKGIKAEKFAYMISRDEESAGFSDYP
ncbi:glycosyl transferase family 17 protein [Moelleriella libera RCEF 2490]|uniref:Glycosyl transferase family 17 protein n=1 Tax=Moelleriella libera RCEF 2490 TaxID=1081109 RepID=A0A167ZL96_9HYPO|nr:glycosyl transferase family 17 protein [Moelleriella libera RCEF 2490]